MSSFLSQLWASKGCPREVSAMIKFKMGVKSFSSDLSILQAAEELNDAEFSYLCLHKVSRSFAVVIQFLDEELRDAICLFYLILRGLDSVEDDMEFPIDKREPLLRTFHSVLDIDGWNISGVGDTDDYRQLLQRFDKIIAFFKTIKTPYQQVIAEITRLMGNGMADFAVEDHQNKMNGVESVEKYELYCHYVAGLVGIGLNKLFIASGLESHDATETQDLANSMGLFLQKTNITRDYLEDYEQQRSWWPKEIWGVYGDDLGFFAKNPDHVRSRLCLNHMIYNGLKHIPDVIEYLSVIKNPTIFNFCAIPQVMAIASLALLYDNTDSLKRTLKIRRGIVCDVAVNAIDIASVKGFFKQYIDAIRAKLVNPKTDPSFNNTSVSQAEREKAIVLYSEYIDLLDRCDVSCEGYTVLSSGWGALLTTLGAVTVAVGATAYAVSQFAPEYLPFEHTQEDRDALDTAAARDAIERNNKKVRDRQDYVRY